MTQQKQGTATVGFKSLTVRILDGNQTITEGENLFIIQGKKEKVRLKPQKSPVLLLTLQKHSEATSLTM